MATIKKKTTVKAKTTTSKTKKNITEKITKVEKPRIVDAVFILDESSSMHDNVESVINNYNRLIDEQKGKDGECYVSTVLFNTFSKVVHNRCEIRNINHITKLDYRPSGCTAYYDALGFAIKHHIYVQKHLPEEKRSDNVIFFIMTDGYENSSTKFTARELKKLINHEQKHYGWEFVFIGAGIDAINAAEDIGITEDRAYCADNSDEGYLRTMNMMSRCMRSIRERGCIDRELEDVDD